jgi:hypothetical protein
VINPEDVSTVARQLNARERSWVLFLSEEIIITPRHLAACFEAPLKDTQAAFKKFLQLGIVTYEAATDSNGKFLGRGYTLGLFGMAVQDKLKIVASTTVCLSNYGNDKELRPPVKPSFFTRLRKMLGSR